MFDIELIGRIKNKKKVQLMCENILHQLMPRTTKDVNIIINFVNQCEGEVAGDCYGDHEEIMISIARTSRGYSYSFEEQILTLCHELVHAKQFIKGELSDTGRVWKGVDMSMINEIENQPWEQEAFRLETELYDKYISMF